MKFVSFNPKVTDTSTTFSLKNVQGMKHYSISAEQVKINIVKHIFRILRKSATELISRDRHSNCTKGGKIQNGSRSCQKRKQKNEKSQRKGLLSGIILESEGSVRQRYERALFP